MMGKGEDQMRIHVLALTMLAVAAVPAATSAETGILGNLRGLAQTAQQLGRIGTRTPEDGRTFLPGTRPIATQDSADPDMTGIQDTSLASLPLAKGDPGSFDVAGLKLGMSPREIVRIARDRHLKIDQEVQRHNPSFEQRVARERQRLQGRPEDLSAGSVSYMHLNDGQGARLEVFFLSTQNGPVAESIRYATPWKGMTETDFVDSLTSKYGKPQHSDYAKGTGTFRFVWCQGPSNGCISYDPAGRPSMTATLQMDGLDIRLEQGAGLQKRTEQAVHDAARGSLPATSRRTTF